MNTRGEMTSSEIITFVIAIGGFIVVLVFLAILYDTGKGQDSAELCRLSILTRATSYDALQATIPLKCATNKICISFSGKKDACSQFVGEEAFPVQLEKVTAKDTIERTLTEAMYSCWSVTGKGRLDLFGSAWKDLGLDRENNPELATCLICSRVAFAPDVPAGLLKQVNLEYYLENTLAPPDYKLPYTELFTDRETRTFPKEKDIEELLKEGQIKDSSEGFEGNSAGNQLAIVFAQNKPENWEDVAKNWGLYIMLPSVIKTPGGFKAKAFVLAAEAAVGAYGAINTVIGAGAAARFCGQFTTTGESGKGGCSLIQAIGYNVKDINSICHTIQSEP